MKRVLLLFFVLAFALTVNAVNLDINSVTYSPSPAVPGGYVDLWVVIKNTSGAESSPVTFLLDLIYPFSLDPGLSAEKELGKIRGHDNILVKYKLRVDSGALNGTYTVQMKTIEEGGSSRSTPYSIDVQRISPQIEIISVNPIEISPGATQEVELELKNIGSGKAIDVLVGSIEDRTVTTTGVVVERQIKQLGSSFVYLKELGAGEQKTVSVVLGVNPEADQETYTVPITIKFKDDELTDYTETKYIGIKVMENARMDSVLSNAEPKPFPGGTTEITFDLFNTGIGDAKSLVVEVSTEIGQFENTKTFIGTMNADDFDSFKETLKLKSDLQKGEYPVTLKFFYKDQYGNDKTLTKTLMLKVYDITEVSTAEFNLWFYIVVLIVLFYVGRFAYNKFIKKTK
ncbi:COG1361 S-layer family protein [Candidatus Micrarchaeota archaeon]|nr:COG1361 S-layer family protein [Candidatus Micrarchaeota archaeon]MBU2476655.1 COG1361 S-layer family protein [Candidatus Micrarchaeota archaeon]